MRVAVCGPADCTDEQARAAFEVGRQLARRNAIVLCGGGPGVMAAVAAGARSLGGLVVAIGPGSAPGSADATVAITTDLGQARNAVLIASADAVIAVGGSWGTLSEVAMAMRRRTDTPTLPVISLGGWRVLDAAGNRLDGIIEADGPEHAVTLAYGPVVAPEPSP
jgi:uncharacterized protein (TIGR00725 family)